MGKRPFSPEASQCVGQIWENKGSLPALEAQTILLVCADQPLRPTKKLWNALPIDVSPKPETQGGALADSYTDKFR